MKTLKCKDLDPNSDCHFEATGETDEEVIKKMYAHAAEAHADKLSGMSDEDKEKMNALMKEKLAG